VENAGDQWRGKPLHESIIRGFIAKDGESPTKKMASGAHRPE
jgi:hypothetical protein